MWVLAILWCVLAAVGIAAFVRIKRMADAEEAELERKRKAREEAAAMKAKMDQLKTDWPAASQFMRMRSAPAVPET